MGQGNFTEDFRLDAIKQITERGHSVADVSKRLGVSTHSLYSWIVSVRPDPPCLFLANGIEGTWLRW